MNLINKINNFSNVREKKFDFVIYPLDLIITVGLDYKTLCDRFENMEPEHEGKWEMRMIWTRRRLSQIW